MDLTPAPEVYLAAALAQQVAWRPDEDPDWQRRIAERMTTEPGFRVVVDAAYRAGREDAAREGLIISGERDMTIVIAALDRLEFSGKPAESEAARDLLKRLPTRMGSDGVYRRDQPRTVSRGDGEDNPEEQRAPIDMGYMSLPVETQRAGELAAWAADPEEQR